MLYTREIEPLERRVANDFLKINSGIEKAFFRNEGRSCDDSWRATHTIGVFQVDEGMKIGDLNEALHAVLKFAVRYPSAQKKAFELLKKCLQRKRKKRHIHRDNTFKVDNRRLHLKFICVHL